MGEAAAVTGGTWAGEVGAVPIHMASGAAARATSYLLLYPVDVLRTRAQFFGGGGAGVGVGTGVGTGGWRVGLGEVVRQEGLLSLWRGAHLRLLYTVPAAGMSFCFYEQALAAASGASGSPGSSGWAAALALVVRLAATGARLPVDIAKQRAQLLGALGAVGGAGAAPAKGTGALRGGLGLAASVADLRKLSLGGDLLPCYRASLLRDVPFALVYFGGFEASKAACVRSGAAASTDELGVPLTLLSGGVAGAVASTLTIPFDVVKTRMQLRNLESVKHALPASASASASGSAAASGAGGAAGGVFASMRDIFQAQGVAGLTSGLRLRLMQVVPSASLTLTLYEAYKHALLDSAGSNPGPPLDPTPPHPTPARRA